MCPAQESQRKLHEDDYPLRVQMQRTQRGEQFHFIVRKNQHYLRRLLLPPSENKITNTIEENSNTRRNTASTAACHKNCVRELSYGQLTRFSTTDDLNQNECQLQDDVTTKTSSCLNKYQPVYKYREINSVCNSFSTLGLGRKMDQTHKILSNSTSHNTTNRKSMVSTLNLNIVREAVNNNPALGYGNYVYI